MLVVTFILKGFIIYKLKSQVLTLLSNIFLHFNFMEFGHLLRLILTFPFFGLVLHVFAENSVSRYCCVTKTKLSNEYICTIDHYLYKNRYLHTLLRRLHNSTLIKSNQNRKIYWCNFESVAYSYLRLQKLIICIKLMSRIGHVYSHLCTQKRMFVHYHNFEFV